ncbi:MAG: N-acetylmuramoyl-L-alanine amidase [Candidatus Latescibacterota bacterium]|jgi:N-acetylmuramoyl-L-alanine amidase
MRLPLVFQHILLLNLCLFFMTSTEVPALTQIYVVQKGDSLWEIAKKFDISVKELKKINHLRSNRIYQGQKLHITIQIPEFSATNGPYFYTKPKAEVQESRNYREASKFKPIEDYQKAVALLRAFNANIDAELQSYKHKSQLLKGWRIVLDPGHGGRDPGAIVSNKDGEDRAVHVVEDEYVYDIAMRLYKKLKLEGAGVELTVISPNHHIRENLQATITFVHEQNEVYHDEKTNLKNAFSVRPASANINQRARIANRFFKGAQKGHTLFISVHADNSPNRPKGPLVLYQNSKGKIDTRSRTFAQIMQKTLDHPGMPAQIGGRNLAVLRNNNAQAEILVEIRNVHDKGEAWALRFHSRREADADRIFQGVLNYIKKR